MNNKIRAKIKTKKEILETLDKNTIEQIKDDTYGILLSDDNRKQKEKIGKLHIPNWLWNLCGKEIELSNGKTQSHQYDYYYFDFPLDNNERNFIPVLYFMEEWVERIEENTPEQLSLFNL